MKDPEEKLPLGEAGLRGSYDVKIDVKERLREYMDWVHLPEDRVQ
jgi:hypothetical protein